jgi:Cof subfamily protein (haloacid dehalogenase superfamily)
MGTKGVFVGKIKLVITDLDGTFLDSHSTPGERNVQALEACEAAGIPVRAVTARSFSSAKRVFHLGGFRGLCVTSNGGSIYDVATGEALYRKGIEKDRVALILALCEQAGADLFAVARGANIRCETISHYPPKFNFSNRDEWPQEHRPVYIMTKNIEEMAECLGDDAELICMHAPDGQKGFDGEFYRSIIGLGELSLTSSHPGGFDIMASGVTKSFGAQRLAQMMGVEAQEVLALGDHINDIGMLRWAGIGVAMGNAHPRVKQAADYVSLPHDEGGVAQAIYRFAL